MGASDPVAKPLVPVHPRNTHEVLDELGPGLCRLLAEPHPGVLVTRLRTALTRMAEALGGDDACVRYSRDDGASASVATSDAPAELLAALMQGRWFGRQMGLGARLVLPRGAADLPSEASHERAILRAAGVEAVAACPIEPQANITGALGLFAKRQVMQWVGTTLDELSVLANVFGRLTVWATLFSPVPAIGAVDGSVEGRAGQAGAGSGSVYAIIGDSDAIRYVLYRVEQVAPTNATVLLMGETGTGKELVARAIHDRSPRRHRPFVVAGCSAIPATLVDAELFGREPGGFTDSRTPQAGRFELADGGTLFLDDVSALPRDVQLKLLRVLQEGKVERPGAGGALDVDVRVIAAVDRDLADEVRRGTFRRDLFYRLNVFPITLPALRERRDDIGALVRYLVDRLGRQIGKSVHRIPPEAMRTLERYDWPGNLSELENVLQRAIILSRDSTLALPGPLGSFTCPSPLPSPGIESNALADVEREHIRKVLGETSWRIEGPAGAAHMLGLRPSTLRSRMRKLGIQRATAMSARP